MNKVNTIEELRILYSPLPFPRTAAQCTYMLTEKNRLIKITKKKKSRYSDPGEYRDNRIWEAYKGEYSLFQNITKGLLKQGTHYGWG